MATAEVRLHWVAIVSAILVGTASAMALSSIALAGDGSYYLVRILESGEVFGPELRMFGNAVRQAPVLLAARGDVVDTSVLAVVFGLGLLLVPVAAWCLAVLWSRAEARVFVAVSMVAGLCAATTWFFAIGENVIAAPLTALVAVLLWRERAWTWPLALAATFASAILVATYETSLVASSVFVVWAGWRARRRSSRLDQVGAAGVAALSGLAIVSAVGGVVLGEERTPDHVRSLAYFVVSLSPWPLYLGIVAIAAIVLGLSPALASRARTALLTLGICAAALTAVGFDPTVGSSFAARGGAPIAVILLQLFLFGLWARAARGARTVTPDERANGSARWLVLVPVVFVAAAGVADLRALVGWSRSLDAFRAEVGRTDGVQFVDVALPDDRRQVVWGWSSSSLSLIVRPDPNAGVLVDRDPSFVPFSPDDAHEQLPAEYAWGR